MNLLQTLFPCIQEAESRDKAAVPPQASDPIETVDSNEASFDMDCNYTLNSVQIYLLTVYFPILLPI